jgi:hypothetical protein
MLANVNIKASQSQQIDIEKIITKASYSEVKKMACHLYLGQMIKRRLRHKRHVYLTIKHAKENYSFEDRMLAFNVNLDSILPLDRQIPAREILELLISLLKKQLDLRQLVVCKLAVNSLDTHYILAKA